MEKTFNKNSAKPWAISHDEILKGLVTSKDSGLNRSEAHNRHKKYGPNRLRKIKTESIWKILLNQLRSFIMVLLVIAAVLSLFFHEWVDGIAITTVIVINTLIGFVVELKAVRSMESLRLMEKVTTRVRRDGRVGEIEASELVPGDIVLLEGGDIVNADLRLIDSSKLQVDESVLTGESHPVSKNIEPVSESASVNEQTNMLFKGTSVTRGSAEAVVVATGMSTEFGHISFLVEEAEKSVTPLEKRLDRLGQRLVWITLAIIVVIALVGVLRGRDLFVMVNTAIALGVAAIPEGLPIVATLALARGTLRMARRNALVNRLAAVETLGSTGVICTDKTGTLTENRMTVKDIVLPQGHFIVGKGNVKDEQVFQKKGNGGSFDKQVLTEALKIGVLCANASLEFKEDGSFKASGEPLEVALMVAAAKGGIKREHLLKELPEQREESFDPELKMMATFHKENSRYLVAVKGAPETVIESCSEIWTEKGNEKLDFGKRKWWNDQNGKLAKTGLRVLALATKTVQTLDVEPYRDLTLIGLVGMLDPPRDGVANAIGLCRKAGIQVVMVTGDNSNTALSIAFNVGLVDNPEQQAFSGKDIQSTQNLSDSQKQRLLNACVFARVSPAQKLNLIDLHQKAGSVVAMTGDGVNDAPALKKADIGIAMGKRGTQVAREAADMVLKDDALGTIVIAIEQGRVIFNNIRKFVVYLLSCNLSEIMIVFIAAIINAPLPITPLQILFLNLVTDVFPALALGFGSGEPNIMHRKPRSLSESILPRRYWLGIAGYSTVITISVLGVFAAALKWMEMSTSNAVTVSFLTLGFAQLWHVFNMRNSSEGFVRNSIVRNPYVWGAIGLCIALLLMAVYIPVLSTTLNLKHLNSSGWAMVIGASLIPFVIGQIFKAIKKNDTD